MGQNAVILDVASAQLIVDAAGLDFTVAACTPLPAGDNSQAFDLHDRRTDAHLVAKVYGEALGWKMGKEVLVYDRLSAVDIPTPRILVADDGRRTIDATYSLMTKLDGQPASTVTPTATPDEIRAIFTGIGAAARACHRVGFDAFGYIGPRGLVDPAPTNERYMAHEIERHLRQFRDLGGAARVAAAVERRIDAEGFLFGNCRQAVLCHDDLHEENVLVARRRGTWAMTGILDVENAIAADPLLDLAKTDYYAREEPLRRSGLLEGYGALPDDGPARLALYRLHHALALWCWFARIGRGHALPSIMADVARLAA